ncbi:MAG TPA: PilZ domain-containing protein [Candidatus Acidoferrum sp.]|nr:PilZ domain-containing protein [Candidatus Acidoferrum sp.]
MTLKTDRRTQHRKRPLSLVYVELPPSNGGMMRDVSEHGFSLRAMMPLQQSEKIPFSFVLDSSARIDGEAIVVRLDDGGHMAALEFAGLSAHFRDQIRRWLDKFDETISPEPAPVQSNASKHVSLTELRAQIRPLKSAPKPARPEGTTPTDREPSPPPPLQAAEVASQPHVVGPPAPEPPSAPPIAATAESAPPPLPVAAAPPVTETPQLPIPPPHELPTPVSPPSPATVEQKESPPLPPLLKLSSVRPGPLPTEISEESAAVVEPSIPATEPPARYPLSLPKAEPRVGTQPPVADPPPVPRLIPRRAPPALEPLSSFEAETDSETPGWMDRFTLGRAIGIMLFLTLFAGSYVYHRELGQALIWLGHQIAGDESPENSKIIQPRVPSTVQPAPEPTSASRTIEPPSAVIQHSTDTTETSSTNLPAASDKTPSPQLKSPSPGSLVPLTQVTRPPAPTPSAGNSAEPGQPEYLQALQILRSPSRSSEVPAAVQLLWAAVEKGNTGAEIDLAELFRTGRGVTKNCDQTRVLLSAAARKGSPEARKRLEAFQRQGCDN